MLICCANSEDFDLAFWDDLGDDLRVEIKGRNPGSKFRVEIKGRN